MLLLLNADKNDRNFAMVKKKGITGNLIIKPAHQVFRVLAIAFMLVSSGFYVAHVFTNTAHAVGQVYLVTNTNDTGPGSLRQAITDANANAVLLNGEPHNIQFNIPGSGVQTIALQSALPDVL